MRKKGKDLHILEKSSNFAAWKVLWRIYNLQFTMYNLQFTIYKGLLEFGATF